jgi:two-component system, OmpR family, response regulator
MIEDSKEIVELVQDLLRHVGPFEVVAGLPTEMDGTAWLETADHPKWQVAIIDLVLREGSGFNLIRRYREANENARILVLSDYTTPGIRVRCVELGADAVFSKGEVKAFANYLSGYHAPKLQPAPPPH